MAQNVPSTMKGIELIGNGGYECLKINHQISVPRPSANDVLIQVFAAGVNNTDINTRNGWYSKKDGDSSDAAWNGKALEFPRIQGADVCGKIVDVGENVSKDRIGERVLIEPCLWEYNSKPLERPWYFGSECDGGFAEYTVVSSKHAHKVESNLTYIELASFPCSYSTAENLLTKSKVKKDERVLITGASGGVGSAAIQLAKARGAYVIALTSPKKEELLMALGADEVADRNKNLVEVLGESSVDVVIDLVGGSEWPKLLDVLKSHGRYAVAGAIAGAMVNLDLRTLYLKDLSFFGCTVLEPEVFPNLIKRIENDEIRPIVGRTFSLEEIEEAQKFFEEKTHVGKVVLIVDE